MKRNTLFYDKYNELLEILNCLNVGVYITDGQGRTIMLNDTSCNTGGLTRKDVMGKNMKELEEMGFIAESITLKVLGSGATENMIQYLGDGGQVYVTGYPFYRNEEIEYVVCTERDITEMAILKEILIEKEAQERKYEKEIRYLKDENIQSLGDIVTNDQNMKELIENTIRAAKHDTTVLITGESGTGKELFANMIYQHSNRVNMPFIKINCAAIPENLIESEFFGYEKGAFTGATANGKIGYFELADKGTLFLDEIGELPVQMQSKILRAIQEKEILRIGGKVPIAVDVRIVAATNADLKENIAKGLFRKDLYYRLNVMPIQVPPLRERKNDIEKITNYFLEKYSKIYKVKKHIEKEAVEVLEKHDWPGNVRELENIVEHLIIRFDGNEITKFQVNLLLNGKVSNLNIEEIADDVKYKDLMECYERSLLSDLISKYKKPYIIASKLNINKSTLSRKLKKYGLESID